MSLIDFALKLEGATDQQIADADRAVPGFARLAADLKQATPVLKQMSPHVDALAPLVAQLWPIFKRAEPDIVLVAPAVGDAADILGKT
jgi:hypothetical protein